MKDLVIKQNSKVLLSKTKTLFDITKSILDKEIVVKNKDLINPKISYDQNRAIEFDDGEESKIKGYYDVYYYTKTPLIRNMNWYYLSATTDVNDTDGAARGVYFNSVYDNYSHKVNSLYVRCVRDGGEISY